MRHVIEALLIMSVFAAAQDSRYPLEYKIVEGHLQSDKCWMTMTEEAEDMGYVVEEVSVFSCVYYHPGSILKGRRDGRFIDLVGTDKKGKVKVTRWEIRDEAKP